MKRNWLKGIAIALIILPEPFTTPVGAVLLLVSFVLPRRQRQSLRNMEALMRCYLNTTQPNGFNRLTYLRKLQAPHRLGWSVPSPLVNKESVPYPHVTAYRDYIDRKTRAEFQPHYLTDARKVSDRIIHHVLRTGVPQYEAIPVKPDKILSNSLKTISKSPASDVFHSGLKPIRPVTQTKVVHHSLKRI